MFARRTRVLFVHLGSGSAPATDGRSSGVDVVHSIDEAAKRLSSERYTMVIVDRDPGDAGSELLAPGGRARFPILVLAGAADAAPGGAPPELYQMLDLLPEYAYVRGEGGVLRYANARFRETFGAPEGRTCFELLRERASPCDDCRSVSAARSGEPWIWEDSGGRVFEVRDLAFISRDGEPRILEIGADITEERASRVGLESARDVLESLPIGILTFRFAPPDCLTLFDANAAALDVFRGTRAEWLGRPFEDLWPSEMVARVKEPLLAVVRSGEPYEEEMALRRGVSVTRAFRVRAFRLGDDRVVVAFEDTTEETRAKEALARSEETQRSILRASPIGIGLVRDRIFGWVNDTLCEMLGYSVEELVGQSSRVIYEDEIEFERVGREKYAAIATAGVGRIETRWRTKDGESLDVDLQSAPIDPDDLSRGVIFTALDITAKRLAEKDLRRLEAQLRQAQRLESIGTLASGIAHEINNPLMGMINYAALIAERVGDETLRGFAEGVKEEGARVAGIVRSLLSFARGGSEPLRSARPVDIVESALGLVRALLVKDGIVIDVDVSGELPMIHCRPHELQQVLLNLLTNARDALNERYPSGGDPGKRLRILGEVTDSGRVQLTVEDEGIGVAPDHLERVFDPFFTTKPRDRGTGLGLSVSYGIVRDHGGTLTIDSRPGGPTRLQFEIPVVDRKGDS